MTLGLNLLLKLQLRTNAFTLLITSFVRNNVILLFRRKTPPSTGTYSMLRIATLTE